MVVKEKYYVSPTMIFEPICIKDAIMASEQANMGGDVLTTNGDYDGSWW